MRRIFLVALFLLISVPSLSQVTKWKVEDLIYSESGSQFNVSPDGKSVVWVKSTADKEKDGRVNNLILTSLTEPRELELTRGSDYSNSQPKWSPDGKWIAFVSSRPIPKSKDAGSPRPQIWIFSVFGGEPSHITSGERGVQGIEWLDNDTIVFTAQEDATEEERAIKEKKDVSIVVDDEEKTPPVRLWKVSIKNQRIQRITDNSDRIESFSISGDGRYLVSIHARSLRYQYDQKVKPAVFLYNLVDGSRKQLLEDGRTPVVGIERSRDTNGFFLLAQYSSHPFYVNAIEYRLYDLDPVTASVKRVDVDWPNGLAGNVVATSDGFLALLANGARHKAARYVRGPNGFSRSFLEGEQASNIFEFKLGADGQTLVYTYSTATSPTQHFWGKLEGSRIVGSKQFSNLNPGFKDRAIAKSEVVKWKGALDEEVEGILYYPQEYVAGRKYPLMLAIHGGPFGADYDAWSQSWAYPISMLCERGAFVLRPNYHGSSNYGLKFAESISNGKYYELEVPDVEKGVDDLIAKGLVDPDRIGTMGWSNGSIISTALVIANPGRYKVCSAGAGNVEWASDWSVTVFGASFDNYYLGKSVFEDPMLYLRKAPYYQLDKVRTPTILHHGTIDFQVPTSQSWMHFRALQQLGKVDVRFILYPDEPHGLQRLTSQRRKLEEDLAWFDKYLFKRSSEDSLLKSSAPLAMALKARDFAHSGRLYGQLVKGVLVPEIVKYGKLEVGRFEVTRAQFAAFDKSYVIESGTENFPANKVTYERALAYCKWLSGILGESVSLPNASDVAALYDEGSDLENTLDYWAGFKINPEDEIRIRQKAGQLGGDSPLLKEVGSLHGVGDGSVFDLGGNVAEWVTGANGGTVAGASADKAADKKNAARTGNPGYIGFRVIRRK